MKTEEKHTASPAFVDALRRQARRINVDYRPGAGVYDAYTGDRLDTPGDMYSFFHALDLPYIAPQHRNWAQVIDMIKCGRLVAPGSTRSIFVRFEALGKYEKPGHTLSNPRRQINFETGEAVGGGPVQVDIHSPRRRR